MRNWPKTLPNASFRGVSFHVDSEDMPESGREVALHSFVKAEEHSTEDMGRKARKYRVDGYTCGDAADGDALNLVAVCSQQGDGALLLPLNGYLTVKCTNCSTSMKKDDLGRVKVVMEFLESGNDSAFATIAIGDRIAASIMGGMTAAIVATLSAFAN